MLFPNNLAARCGIPAVIAQLCHKTDFALQRQLFDGPSFPDTVAPVALRSEGFGFPAMSTLR